MNNEKYIYEKISQDINKCVGVWGIEATEEKIYSAYAGSTAIRERYLSIFYKKFNFLKIN